MFARFGFITISAGKFAFPVTPAMAVLSLLYRRFFRPLNIV